MAVAAAEVVTKKLNVEIMITPFPQKVLAIIAQGYGWEMGKATRCIVSAEDAELLELEANRQIKNARTQKMESRARFSFTKIREVELPAKEKLPNRRGVAEVPALKVPHEEQTEALMKNLTENQKTNQLLAESLKILATTRSIK